MTTTTMKKESNQIEQCYYFLTFGVFFAINVRTIIAETVHYLFWSWNIHVNKFICLCIIFFWTNGYLAVPFIYR